MADLMFNIGRGTAIEAYNDGADFIVVLLESAEADDTLRDYNDLGALLTAGGNTEATFTNYARKTITNANISLTVDDTGNDAQLDFPDQTWTSAGNGTNNTLVKLLVCVDGASDAARIPLTLHDFSVTTDGNDLTAQIAAAGFYSSTD